jgi:hypothetical protein
MWVLPIFLRVTVFSLDVMTAGFGKVMHRKKNLERIDD